MSVLTASPATGAPAPAAQRPKVTQQRILISEWTKLRSLRSTLFTMLAAEVFVIGLGVLISWGTARHTENLTAPDFDPTNTSLSGIFLAQLAVGVLGVLAFSGEYGTGMIRATLSAVPRRLPVLWAKCGVFAAVTFVLMAIASLAAFLGGGAIFASHHAGASLTDSAVLTAVVGGALYLTVVGLFGVALGALIRSTAGGIATMFGVLLVLPIIVHVMPANWSHRILPYLPSQAGQAILNVAHQPDSMAPWTGFALFCCYTAAAIAAAAYALTRRDA